MRAKRWIAVLLMAVICVMSLSGCTGTKIPEGMTKEDIEKAAKEVLDLVHEKDYQAIWDRSDTTFQAAVSAEALKEAVEGQIGSYGAFVEYTQQAIGGSHNAKAGDFGVAVITAKYENGKAVYTLSFDVDYKLAGFYVK
ncbi:MAG: DUF3887 domain-containing protein [Lachnospiraceae bacterium]|nr:DUF3887 domain-containing protein [Lachnospiraceae bacterium]